MDNQQATPAELGWLAGILDGEGYVALATRFQRGRTNKNYISCIEISNTEPNLLLKVRDITTKLGVNLHVKEHKPAKTGNRVVFKLECHRFPGVKAILEATLPYLTCKAKRAKLILDFIESRQARKFSNTPYNDGERALVYAVQDLTRSGESSQTTRETLRKPAQR